MMRIRLQVRRSWLGPGLIVGVVLLVLGAGGAASFETGTVSSFWQGLWWSVSLMATVGFIGGPPTSVEAAVLSVVLMLVGWFLLALVSASMASLFVKEDVEPFEAREGRVDTEILAELRALAERMSALEGRLGDRPPPDAEPEEPARSQQPVVAAPRQAPDEPPA